MKGKIFLIGVMVLLVLASAWAADVTGKWTATIPGAQGQGDSTVTLVFKADGNKLTGTLDNTQMPGEIAISEGKINGDDISFAIMRKMGETEMKIVWKGKISGNEIKFVRETQGGMGGPGGGAPSPTIIAKKAN
jgi:hypothetical protein